MKIHEEVQRSLRSWGGHPAIVEVTPGMPDRILSSTELLQGIEEMAVFLRSTGIQQGVPTALLLGSSVEFIQVFLALSSIGAIPILLKLEYRKLELDEIFANSDPGVVIVEKQHLESIRGYLHDRTVIIRDLGSFYVDQQAAGNLKPAEVDSDIASLNYTYRGYGYPIAAMVPHAQYLHGADVLQDGLQGEPRESILFSLPMSHIFTVVGCIMVPLLYRMTAVIARTMQPRVIFKTVKEYHVEIITAVPEIFGLLARLKDPAYDLSSLKVFVSGGSVLGTEEYRRLEDVFGVEVLHGYGLTEFAPVSRNIRGQARAGTMGPPCRGLEARVSFRDAAQDGEIVVRTPNMFRGYYRRESETREAFRDGWFLTGDLGRLDGNHLVFTREKKKTCKINGNLADLEEIRRAILLDREVAEAEVQWEDDAIVAHIAVGSRSNTEKKIRSLAGSLIGIIADYKIPKRIIGI
jgi:long-subunit acyl-CoA synthetase (AMP-forming)